MTVPGQIRSLLNYVIGTRVRKSLGPSAQEFVPWDGYAVTGVVVTYIFETFILYGKLGSLYIVGEATRFPIFELIWSGQNVEFLGG